MIATTKEEIATLREAGNILAWALKEVAERAIAGAECAALDYAARHHIAMRGATPSFLNYQPRDAARPYPAALCVSVNDEVVHGIPTEGKILAEGDVVSLDLGLSYKGVYVDAARTLCVGQCDEGARRLIAATKEALAKAIDTARVGGYVGDIGAAVEEVAARRGFAVVEDLGGHAVGRAVHEKPFIPNVGERGVGERLRKGMVLAIEPMLAEGSGEILLDGDEWTYRMRGRGRAAHFEHTVLLTAEGPEILTRE
jgi:methionyl aminopeptidase